MRPFDAVRYGPYMHRILLIVLLLSGCSDPLVRQAQEAVKRRLRDPESAQFRDVRRCDKPNAVEGEVNARNAYGGYAGFAPFIYADHDVAILTTDDGIGEYVRFDAERWSQLRRLCWSDEVLRRVQAETGNVDNVVAEMEAAAAEIENAASALVNEVEENSAGNGREFP